jgi:hypothetical protein
MDWKALVGKVAPLLGTALGGPFGGMAGKFLADKLGCSPDELEETVINADPDTMLKIKNLENEFKVRMKELGITEQQLHQKDRESARDMAKNTSIVPQVLQSVIYDIAFILVTIFLFTTKIEFSETQQTLITFVMGMLSAGLVQVNNFWFGSSSGSKQKTDLMGNKTQ